MSSLVKASSGIAELIADYLGQQQRSHYHHKKRNDAGKEYNKLLAMAGGEEKRFSLEEAETVYKAYSEMIVNDEPLKLAELEYHESYEKLKDLGRILFYASIHAEITLPPVNGS